MEWLEVLAYLTAWGGLGIAFAWFSAARGGRSRRDPFPVRIGEKGVRE